MIRIVIGFLSFIVLGLTTQISLINNPHLSAYGMPYCEMHDTPHIYHDDHDQIADTIFDVIALHNKMLNQCYDQQHQQHYNDGIIIAKIKGEEAKNILVELENGAGIYFQVTMDEDNNPVVELYKEKSFGAEKV